MDFRGFQEYKPGASRYNGRISEDEWNKHKPKLRELHEAKLTRQQILDIISKDFEDTKPTYGQLCTKFDKWGFHVYRQNERKDTTPGGKKAQRKVAKPQQLEPEVQHAFSPESSNGSTSTIVPDVGVLNISDKSSPMVFGTPQTQYLEASTWSDLTPRTTHSRNVSAEQMSTPPLGTIHEPNSNHQVIDYGYQDYSDGAQTQQWASATSLSTATASQGNRSSMADTASSRTSMYHTMSEQMSNIEPEDPTMIAARTRKADDALDAVQCYLRSVGSKQSHGEHILAMTSLAAYLFATRSYAPAFRIYHKTYETMSQDMECDEISRIGALMKCFQSAVEPADLDFMQGELHQAMRWNFSDSSLPATIANMLQTVEAQISEGFNLAQGSILSTTSITRNLNQLMTKGSNSTYPGTRRLYWRLRLLTHSPFHSGCKRLLRLMSELLSWAWAAMTILKFPDAAVQNFGCLCKDGLYFDFVRMVTTVVMEAAMGFEISQLIKINMIKAQTLCECVMCTDLEKTFEICPIESFTAIALLTVDRCRLDWTSCHPGGRHQELTPNTILKEQLLPTIESLLNQVAADMQAATIHTSDLYDDFLSCVWSTFETHDLPLKNARFDASTEKVEDMMTTLITEELNKSHPARNSTLEEGQANGKMPVFTYGENNGDDLANKITAKRTRSNASALTKSSSNASERSMIRIRKKLKFRTSADYLNSMSSYSSLSSRNSMNRFSYVTGLPELETTLEDDEFDPRDLPPDLTPDEFKSMQRHDSWSRRSEAGHFSWVPSRPGSTLSRSTSWRESNIPSSRQGSTNQGNGISKRPSQKDVVPNQQVMHNQRESVNQAMQQNQQQQPLPLQSIHKAAQPPPTSLYTIQSQSQHNSIPNGSFQQRDPQQQISIQSLPYSSIQAGLQPQMLAQGSMQPPLPVPTRRDSNKTTSSKESQKGRWSSEQKRVERILRMQQ
ncbi:hypothetical protein PMZ80_002220 [Knufia obscura]|uniref:Clr5 domain-containing protein n=2 Tax=Knufia TaxID=430999 RepID=A0AAN8E8U6_9EURO|nr:hypothetical protein PMZ80_002220 [Knufia obscura]KAK5947875.1 hypothetical protein OHC33_011082 [Knufia fluminis]